MLIVCHARRLELVKSIDSTVSIHLTRLLVFSRVRRSVATVALAVLLFASLLVRRSSSHISSQQGT